MAAIEPTVTQLDALSKLIVWTAVTNADTFTAAEITGYGDMTVTIEGTFNSATAVMQGSNDGTNFYQLYDPLGAAISKTAAGISAILEAPRYVRASASGGGGSQSLQVRIMARRQGR